MMPIHPKLVHFPIAFITVSVLLVFLAIFIKNKRETFKEILSWNLIFGTLGSIIAVGSGLREEKSLAHNDAIHSLLETHQLLGIILSMLFILLTIWMIFRKSIISIKELYVFAFFLVISAGIVTYTGHLGGIMVYEQGAGVIPMEEKISGNESDNDHSLHDHSKQPEKKSDEHEHSDHNH